MQGKEECVSPIDISVTVAAGHNCWMILSWNRTTGHVHANHNSVINIHKISGC